MYLKFPYHDGSTYGGQSVDAGQSLLRKVQFRLRRAKNRSSHRTAGLLARSSIEALRDDEVSGLKGMLQWEDGKTRRCLVVFV